MAAGGAALGTIIGEAGARELAAEAGFQRFEGLPIPSPAQQFFVLSDGVNRESLLRDGVLDDDHPGLRGRCPFVPSTLMK